MHQIWTSTVVPHFLHTFLFYIRYHRYLIKALLCGWSFRLFEGLFICFSAVDLLSWKLLWKETIWNGSSWCWLKLVNSFVPFSFLFLAFYVIDFDFDFKWVYCPFHRHNCAMWHTFQIHCKHLDPQSVVDSSDGSAVAS